MRVRIASSVLVVVFGLVPTLIGGPVFALALIGLGVAGYREFLDLAARITPLSSGLAATAGVWVITALGLAALLQAGDPAVFALAVLAVLAPLLLMLPDATPGAFAAWSLLGAGTLYLGLPVYAAIALRSLPGAIQAGWLTDLAGRLSLGWDTAPRGLAWALTVILAIWVADSAAYLVGRALGQRKLAPKISPNKTIEGSFGGLAGAMLVCTVAFSGFGIGAWWHGLLIGAAIGICGQLGDLSESFFKRQAGVKDSGSVIPGHGGLLDRIDALLFAFPVGYVLAIGVSRLGAS